MFSEIANTQSRKDEKMVGEMGLIRHRDGALDYDHVGLSPQLRSFVRVSIADWRPDDDIRGISAGAGWDLVQIPLSGVGTYLDLRDVGILTHLLCPSAYSVGP